MSKKQQERGITLLLAVLLSSILIAIGLAIFNITIKELILSSIGRESQFAFYAADTGTECALYWDQKGNAFSTSTDTSITCDSEIITVTQVPLDTPTTFKFDVDGYCAIVTVIKSDTHPRTKIESRGYNTNCDASANPRRVERALRVTY